MTSPEELKGVLVGDGGHRMIAPGCDNEKCGKSGVLDDVMCHRVGR